MSRPEARSSPFSPGRAITLELAPRMSGAVAAIARPLVGWDELRLCERRDAVTGIAPVHLETAVLEFAVEVSPEEVGVEALLLGDRNRLILAVLCASYGAPGTLLMPCPDDACGEKNEMAFDPWLVLGGVPVGPADGILDLAHGGAALRIRLPTGADLTAAAAAKRQEDALLRRCLSGAVPSTLDAIRSFAEAEIAKRDPCAEIVFSTRCAACGGAISGRLDPLALLLREVDAHGGVLSELDQIARAYHWSEGEILALPAHRRRRYLDLISETLLTEPRRRAS